MSDIITDNIKISSSTTNLALFVSDLRQRMIREYDRSFNHDLSQQNSQYLLKRNLTTVLQGVYSATLTQLPELIIDLKPLDSNDEFSPGALQVLKLFDGIVEELLQYAIKKHKTSCALSNFPVEHKPDKNYIAQVIEAAARDWASFAVQVKDVLTAADTQFELVS